jgi:hypothetical protein
VVGADEFVAVDGAHAERHAAVQADVARGGHRAARRAVEHEALVEELRAEWPVRDLMREGDRMPVRSERLPIRLQKSAVAREHETRTQRRVRQ